MRLLKIAGVMLTLDFIWLYLIAGNAFSAVVENIQGSICLLYTSPSPRD